MHASRASRIEKVLVVDDEDTWLRAVKRRLPDRRVLFARDAEAACRLALTEHPELVLVDLRLGFASDIDVLRRVKADVPDLPIVLMSCWFDAPLVGEAFDAGADYVLEKTVDVKHIVESIERGTRPVEPVIGRVLTAKQAEGVHLQKILAACDGNKSEAARRLGIRRTTLQEKLQRNLERGDVTDSPDDTSK
ncbi:MAG: Dna binding response regulator PrrA [Myxococcales bacterium]|nr:Dna binding response regulator PrrA [Myxococcales bacterium]